MEHRPGNVTLFSQRKFLVMDIHSRRNSIRFPIILQPPPNLELLQWRILFTSSPCPLTKVKKFLRVRKSAPHFPLKSISYSHAPNE